MEILECPKCKLSDCALYFKPKRAGGRLYPKVKHYKPSKKSRESWCNISVPNISKIEFRDLKLNAWKSILDPMDWHKIPRLSSMYSDIDSYRNRSEFENIYEKFLDIMSRETDWVRKSFTSNKRPKAFTHYGDIVHMQEIPSTVVELFVLIEEIEKLRENNNDPELLLFLMIVIRAHNIAAMVRKYGIHLVPLETATEIHVKGNEKTRIMTRKSALRILQGHTREVLPILDPNNRDESLAAQFYGTQCTNPDCKSWRTNLVPAGIDSKCICHACGTTGFEAGIRPYCPQCHRRFYDSVVREMIKTAVDDGDRILTCCIFCKEEVSILSKKTHREIFRCATNLKHHSRAF